MPVDDNSWLLLTCQPWHFVRACLACQRKFPEGPGNQINQTVRVCPLLESRELESRRLLTLDKSIWHPLSHWPGTNSVVNFEVRLFLQLIADSVWLRPCLYTNNCFWWTAPSLGFNDRWVRNTLFMTAMAVPPKSTLTRRLLVCCDHSVTSTVAACRSLQ